jgi:raffinose/stachyose/melibiose transport system substrate-binding protein
MMTRRAAALLLLVLLAGVAAACGAAPGGDDDASKQANESEKNARKIDVAKAGPVTLTVWDQEVRGGQQAQIKRLNAAFQAKYPNVKIKRVAKSFADLNATLKLAVSGDRAPDVVQANQGRPVMGQLVKGGLLRPLDAYEKAYGWDDRYADLLLDLNRFTPDAKTFGDGKLYGVSQMGEIVGVFYNRAKVTDLPKTFPDFEKQIAAVKQRGDVPVAFGNLDKWPGIHDFQTVQNAYVAPDDVRNFVFARSGASIDTPENQEAATKLQDWAKRGYFTPDFNGTGYDPAWQQFARGKGTFLIAGTWLVADLEKRMGKNVGFMLAPPKEAGGDPVSLGGESLPFTITTKSKHPDVAAAYIDFLTNADAARVLVETGNLPAMPTSAQPGTPLRKDMFAAWRTLTEHEGIVPYLDYTTPTFYDDITSAIQRLLAGRLQPDAFTSDLQGDFTSFADENR